jgi:hypothetical protein
MRGDWVGNLGRKGSEMIVSYGTRAPAGFGMG